MPKLTRLEEELLKEKFTSNDEYRHALSRLDAHEPLAYILGEWYFYGETYKVTPDCLIPRPETEHLVEELIHRLPKNAIFADLCTGSGCISISVLAHRPDLSVVAVDISENALTIAMENAVLNGVSDRITFVTADVLSGNALGDTHFDAIVSNPPYIRTDVISGLSQEVRCEPVIALDGGADGLNFYRIIFNAYVKNVKHGGFIVCEIGYDQGDILGKMFGCRISKDYSGNDRIARLDI